MVTFIGYYLILWNLYTTIGCCATLLVFEEAYEKKEWWDTIIEDFNSIKNYVWEIILRPMGKSMIDSIRLYKIKHATNGSIEKYKLRFVARGFS
jgi:hypothetical protein